MNNNAKIIVIRKPETSNYVVYGQSTTSQFITFKNDSSVIPSSLDQIMKNNSIIIMPMEMDLHHSQSAEFNNYHETVG